MFSIYDGFVHRITNLFVTVVLKSNLFIFKVLNKWPLVVQFITTMTIGIILLFFLAVVAIIITAILIPGFMENIGFVQIVGSTPRADLFATNLMIINNAYYLNVGKLANIEQEQNNELASLGAEYSSFNNYEETRVSTFNTQYE